MEKKAVRGYQPVTAVSRLWLAGDRVCSPGSNMLVYEGTGSFDLKNWKEAVRVAGEAARGSRLVLRGMFGSRRWVDSGIAPPVREIDGTGWDGIGDAGAPFLHPNNPAVQGPNAEVLLLRGNPARVVFRSHHAIMDGRGTMIWSEDVSRVLRGEKPLGADYTMTEVDLLNVEWGKRKKPLPHDNITLTGPADGPDVFPVWKRKTITGCQSRLLARVILLAAREARRHGSGNFRIGIPVDLRSRREGLRATGNLTNALYIDIPEDIGVDRLSDEIKSRVAAMNDGEITWEDILGRHIPVRLLEMGICLEGARCRKSGRYRFSGLISNFGLVDIKKFSCDSFRAHTYFAVPLVVAMIPFLITISGVAGRSELVLSMQKNQATGGRLEEAIDNIVNGLGADL